MKYLILLALLFCTPAMANAVTPLRYTGNVRQEAQQGVIIHRAPTDDSSGYQELVLRIVPGFEGPSTPSGLVWIVPLPSPAVRFAVAEKDGARERPGTA